VFNHYFVNNFRETLIIHSYITFNNIVALKHAFDKSIVLTVFHS